VDRRDARRGDGIEQKEKVMDSRRDQRGALAMLRWVAAKPWRTALQIAHAGGVANRVTGRENVLWEQALLRLETSRRSPGEAFTGTMTDEYLVVDSDKKAIQDEGNEVISQLPANAQCYHHGTLEVGKVSKIQGSCGDGPIQSNPNPGMNHGGECDNPECVFLGIGERGSRSLQQTLVHHLRKCCRNTDSKTRCCNAHA